MFKDVIRSGLNRFRGAARSRALANSTIDPRRHQPPTVPPGGLTKEQVLDLFTTIEIDGHSGGELRPYAEEDLERFILTFGLIPPNPRKILEIGSNPYFMTLLLKWFLPHSELAMTNYFGPDATDGAQTVVAQHPSGVRVPYVLPFKNLNVENTRFPYEDGAFDCILFCEVIEHLTNDPQFVLGELRRILSDDGVLIMTTPNVARLENVARLISGANMYDPYSGYGPYGRHNREYTRHELWSLMQHCGFAPDIFFTADVHPNRYHHFFGDVGALESLLSPRALDLGQYHMTRWKPGARPATVKKLAWLYRSYPAEDLV